MPDLLMDRTAVVTGGSRGIGEGICYALGREGARVAVVGNRRLDLARGVVKRIVAKGGTAQAFGCDVTRGGACRNLIAEVVHSFGGVDILVNNAGIYPRIPFVDISDETRDRCWDVNVKGTWNCTKAVLPIMLKHRWGRIINISSVTGPMVSAPGYTAYAMSKGAISAMTRSLALEVAPYGINVNAILPGSVDTPGLRDMAVESGKNPDQAMADAAKTIPLGRLGTGEDIGGAAVFLASEYARYITGAEIVVDGGNVIQELKRARES